jgi:hypothetical protein
MVLPSKMGSVKGFRPGSKVVAKAKWSRNRPLRQRRQWVIVTVKVDAVVLFPGGIKVYGYVTRQTNIKCGRPWSSSTLTVVIVGHRRPWSMIEVFAVIGSRRRCRQGSRSYKRPHPCHAKKAGVVVLDVVSPEGSRRCHLQRSQSGGVSLMDMRRSLFKVGRRRRVSVKRVKRASGVISGVLALPLSVVVDRCGHYHRQSPLVGVMRERTSSLPSKASVIIIDVVRDCGHSPLAAAIVSSIRGERSGGWSCGGCRCCQSWVWEARRSQAGQVDGSWVMGHGSDKLN